MISKSVIKHIRNLHKKKFRKQYKLFVLEGDKLVCELLNSNMKYHKVYALKEWIKEQKNNILQTDKIEVITEKELFQLSTLKSPNKVIAIVDIPESYLNYSILNKDFFLVLDRINNPGNLGTIIRMADWFGIKNIICSEDSVECFNSKVTQASMGSIFRVKLHYVILKDFVHNCIKKNIKLIGATMTGKNMYDCKYPDNFGLVLGSESKGISEEVLSQLDQSITIPKHNNSITNSLNVAMAASIIISDIKRSIQK